MHACLHASCKWQVDDLDALEEEDVAMLCSVVKKVEANKLRRALGSHKFGNACLYVCVHLCMCVNVCVCWRLLETTPTAHREMDRRLLRMPWII